MEVANEIIEFQLSCMIEDSESCDRCSFFQGCQRKYLLKNEEIEYFIQLPEAIILFPSFEVYQEFIEMVGYVVLQKGSYDFILELSEKLELEVGKDLQYIRINGTLVGGFVGLIIYIITHLFI